MGRSWELTDDQKREIQAQQKEIGAQYDPETGKKSGATENTGENEDAECLDARERADERSNERGDERGNEIDDDGDNVK